MNISAISPRASGFVVQLVNNKKHSKLCGIRWVNATDGHYENDRQFLYISIENYRFESGLPLSLLFGWLERYA